MSVNKKRILIGFFIVISYLFIAGIVIGVAYFVSPPQSAGSSYKDFWTRVGIVLTATGVFLGLIVSLFNLNSQIIASQELESLKAQITRQNDFIKQIINVKSLAYEKMFIASNLYYRELENLALGKYNENRIYECEKSFIEAEALSANLDDDDIEIIRKMRQRILDMVAEVEALNCKKIKLTEFELECEFKKIWVSNLKGFGKEIKDFRSKSLYKNKDIKEITEERKNK